MSDEENQRTFLVEGLEGAKELKPTPVVKKKGLEGAGKLKPQKPLQDEASAPEKDNNE